MWRHSAKALESLAKSRSFSRQRCVQTRRSCFSPLSVFLKLGSSGKDCCLGGKEATPSGSVFCRVSLSRFSSSPQFLWRLSSFLLSVFVLCTVNASCGRRCHQRSALSSSSPFASEFPFFSCRFASLSLRSEDLHLVSVPGWSRVRRGASPRVFPLECSLASGAGGGVSGRSEPSAPSCPLASLAVVFGLHALLA